MTRVVLDAPHARMRERASRTRVEDVECVGATCAPEP